MIKVPISSSFFNRLQKHCRFFVSDIRWYVGASRTCKFGLFLL
ncbi:hypothetical protein BIW11_09602 [Tropilaelaps mercedesae]|uniref:Uncharacterized protein n=1 Tax=Tropilaelaps mercedesae TaxID=418985 RepID=A0A1V9XJG6_9ACAR|nr:hypothetical protein BIW11_09602 [Tropilaelaps mercedesae]